MAKISDIISKVKVIIDENEHLDGGFMDMEGKLNDPDQLQTDDILRTLIPIAVDKVNKMADPWMLEDLYVNVDDEGSIGWEDYDTYCSMLRLPKDMLRLLFVRVGGWMCGVTNILNDEDPLFSQYFSPYAGIRPTTIKPSATLTHGADGYELVVCPKAVEGKGKNSVTYLRNSEITDTEDGEEEISVGSKVHTAVLYCIAQLYFMTINEKQRADMMAAECASLLGIELQNMTNE